LVRLSSMRMNPECDSDADVVDLASTFSPSE
jgi:hypothetical protein